MNDTPAPAIEINGISKSFKGTPAVAKLSLTIREQDIFGFIGPNGAGKTTTMRMLATLLPPDTGDIRILGLDIKQHARQVRHQIGYMPDFFGVYRDMEVEEYLYFFGTAYSLPRDQIMSVIEGVLELTDLTDKRHALIGTLSRGMQQRLGLARVLVHDPKVLLLDEPASGLDPRARIEIRELLKELGRMGKTIFISSHILSDLADICTRVGIIEQGNLLFAGTIEEAFKQVGGAPTVQIRIDGDMDAAQALCESLDGVLACTREDGCLHIGLINEEIAVAGIVKALVEGGFGVNQVSPVRLELEDAFMSLTEGKLA